MSPFLLGEVELLKFPLNVVGLRDKSIISILIYTAARIGAVSKLKVKDLYDSGDQYCLHFIDKGGKSRTVRLPRSIMPRLMAHVENVRTQWAADQAKGIIYPSPEPEDMKKQGRNRFGTLPYCWLFPSRDAHGAERWHATDHALSNELKKALYMQI